MGRAKLEYSLELEPQEWLLNELNLLQGNTPPLSGTLIPDPQAWKEARGALQPCNMHSEDVPISQD